MNEIISKRHSQLEIQKEQDKILKELHCKEVVLEYLFRLREENRKYTKEFQESNIFNYFSITNRQLNEIDTQLKEVNSLLTNKNVCPCFLLKEYLQK